MKDGPGVIGDGNKGFYDSGWDNWQDMKMYGPMSRHTRRLCTNIIKQLDFISVLDAGCGEGSLLDCLKAIRPSIEVNGIDISESAIARAGRRLGAGKFYTMDLADDFINEKFDLVLAIEVIEHIGDDEGFLKNIRKMTKKYFLVCTLTGRMRPFEKEMGHVRNYSKAQLLHKLELAGFEIVDCKEWGFPFYSPLYRDLCQSAPKGATVGRFGLFRKALSDLIYALLFLNFSDKGDLIFILAKPR